MEPQRGYSSPRYKTRSKVICTRFQSCYLLLLALATSFDTSGRLVSPFQEHTGTPGHIAQSQGHTPLNTCPRLVCWPSSHHTTDHLQVLLSGHSHSFRGQRCKSLHKLFSTPVRRSLHSSHKNHPTLAGMYHRSLP